VFLIILRGLVMISWFGWVLIYWRGGASLGADITRALHAPQTRWDAALLLMLTGCTFVIAAGSLAVTLGRVDAPRSAAAALIGGLLTWLGIWGTFHCRRVLGAAWTARTQVGVGQELVDIGPYGKVRHPIYTFAISMYIGLGLVFPAWWIGLAALLVVLGYILKTKDEDAYLRLHLPGYADYARRVPYRLIARVW
jgi:protein-S-isoprenylcysteine O-methyltransferase Ste14